MHALGVGALVSAARVAPLLSPEVAAAVADGGRLRVAAVVVSDPAPVRPRVVGATRARPAVDVRVSVVRMAKGGAWEWQGSLPAVLRADAALSSLLPGTRVEVVASPAPGDPGRGFALRLRARSPVTVLDDPAAVQQAAGRLREGLVVAVADRPRDAAGLLPGLVLGDVRGMPADLADDMRLAGLSHLVAVSGANVAIVVGAGLAIAGRLRVRGGARAIVAAGVIVGFVLLVRAQPSVLRAAAMGGVGVVALWAGGRRRGPPALAAAVLLLICVDPWLASSYGFALSVAATGGLLACAGRLTRWSRRWLPFVPVVLAEATAVTVSAQLATTPLLVAMGGPVGPVSVPANLLAAPAVAPATLVGLAATIVSPVSPAVASWLAVPATWASGWIAGVARAAAGWPGTDLAGVDGPGAGLVAAGVVAATLVACHRGGRGRTIAAGLLRKPTWPRRVGAAAAAVLIAVTALPTSRDWPPPGWVAVACDVGQGDAVVLAAGEGAGVVVDTGPDPRAVDRCLRDLAVSRVAAVVLTHFHADHVEGLPGVLRGRDVGVVTVSPLPVPADEAERVAGWAADAGVPVEVAAAGDERASGPLRWRVVWPTRLIRRSNSPPNDASIVLVAESAGVRLLLTGDIQPLAQAAVRSGTPPPHVHVLKVPHHGSRFQDAGFSAWSGARLALVSAGRDNDYGHPAPALLAALAGAGIEARRTDLDGDLAVVRASDGRVGVVARGSG